MRQDENHDRVCKVVIDEQKRYSIWFADRENAPGWTDVGITGSKQQCLEYIEQAWNEMRPASLRKLRDHIESQRKAACGSGASGC